MDCKDFQLYSSAYIDNMLSKEEELHFKNHIKECSACKISFENLKIIVKSTNMIEEVELPPNFSDELHKKLQNTRNYKINLFSKNKILSSIVAVLLVVIVSLSLVNNFLNYKKDAQFFSSRDNIVTESESANKGITAKESKEKLENKVLSNRDDEEPILSLRMTPVEEKTTIPVSILILVASVVFLILKMLKR